LGFIQIIGSVQKKIDFGFGHRDAKHNTCARNLGSVHFRPHISVSHQSSEKARPARDFLENSILNTRIAGNGGCLVPNQFRRNIFARNSHGKCFGPPSITSAKNSNLFWRPWIFGVGDRIKNINFPAVINKPLKNQELPV